MSVGDEATAILREIERIQQAGVKIPEGMTPWQFAAKNLARGNVLSRIGQIADKVTSVPADLLRSIKTTAIITLLGLEGENLIQRLVTERRLDLNPIPPWLEPLIGSAIRSGSESIGAPFFDLLIKEPLGLDLSALPGEEGAEAVRALQRLYGFSTLLDFGTSEIRDILKASMGDNAPTALLEAIERIPRNVGVDWAVGFLLSQFVWTSYMPPLVAKANEQARPARLSPAEVMTLVQRGLMPSDTAVKELRQAGYRDKDIPLMGALAEARLSLADLQQAYVFGLRSEGEIRQYLQHSGVTVADTELIIALYLKRQETAGGDQLRAVAQSGFLQDHLTEDQYRVILQEVNVPPASADLEIAAARLSKSFQRKSLTVADIKAMYAHGMLSDAEVVQRLVQQHYTETDALSLVQEWRKINSAGQPGLTTSRILSYMLSGVLTKTEAYDKIVANGVRPSDASFLVEHPTAALVTKSHGPSDTVIASALKDGVVTIPQAESLLKATGMSDEAVNLRIKELSFDIARSHQPRQEPKVLSDAQILDALRYGLATSAWATRALVANGYTEASALTIVAIEEVKSDPSHSIPDGWTLLT